MNRFFVPITDLLTEIIDNRGKSVPTVEDGIPLIATNCIKHSSIYPTFENIRYVSQEVYDNWFRAHLKANDILFVNKGTPGRVCLVPDPVAFCAAQDMIAFRADETKVYFRYLFAALRSSDIQQKIKNYHVGLVIPHFKKQDLSNLLIPIIDIDSQKKVGDLYHILSEKIELNNRINKELETMAKTLYDYWFVQFDFPDANGKPYRSSGGRMVYNEQLKREIPEGWEVKSLWDIATYTNGLACQKYRPISDHMLKVIKIREMRDGFTVDSEFVRADIPESVIVNDGDVLFSWSASLEVMVWHGGIGGLNQHIFKVTSDKYPKVFFLYELINYLGHFKMMAENRKTTMGHITKEHLQQSRIVVPKFNLIKKIDTLISPILDKILINRKENQQLASLRDWLLPMLMNGQVGFKENGKHTELTVKKCTPSESAVLAARIIAKNQNKDFGRVKLMKNLFLLGYSFDLDLGYPLYRDTAGPHNEDLIEEIEGRLKRYKIYETSTRKTRNGRDLTVYSPMVDINQADTLFEQCFADHAKEIDTFLDKLSKLSWEKSEIVATLYAVWNNRLIKKESVDINSLIESFYAWSENKKKYTKEQILSAYEYMQIENLIPTGRGKYIEEKPKK